VLISKAMIEIPPKFAGRPPVNPESRKNKSLIAGKWKGAQGLAEDVRYYGQWMRDEAEKRIGHLYPKVVITKEMANERKDLVPLVGKSLTVVAWLWARTVKSPNPAFAKVEVPLASSFILSPMSGKEAFVEPVIEDGGYRFTVKVGKPKDAAAAKRGTKLARGANFKCLMSGAPMDHDYVRGEFQAKRAGERMMAIVAEGERGRVYLAPTREMEAIADQAHPHWRPEQEMNQESSNLVSGRGYGIQHWHELFTRRQLVALTTFSDLVQEAREQAKRHGLAAGLSDDRMPLDAGGTGATAYGDAVATYLGFLVSRLADKGSTICTWNAGPASSRTASGRSAAVATVRSTFGRQALPMTWDFAEVNFLSGSTGGIDTVLGTLTVPLQFLPIATPSGISTQADAVASERAPGRIVSTDPPYYDNIAYADLSDFFYVWLRHSLKSVFPNLFSTLEVPKAAELVATPYRHGSNEKAESFFLDGMTQAMRRISEQSHPDFPVTIYYAFKQSETDSDGEGGTSSTGWDTFLEAVIRANFAISGTWPIRTERGARSIGIGTNSLASSIVLVCRQRDVRASTATRREFLTVLKGELLQALAHLQRSNIAPVDLAQAAIGPGMAVYTRFSKVLDAEGRPLKVREALALINQTLDEALAQQEGDFDPDSRWALAWFEQHGFGEGEFGVADVLARAKNTSVQGLVDAGVLRSSRGDVRLLKPSELATNWDPATDTRLSAWESVHQLIRVLESGGEASAAELVAKLGSKAELARELCYRLYTLCERKKRAAEALSYNGLVQSFPELERLAKEPGRKAPAQASMLVEDVE
jgi:putative DNA methylase